VAAATARNAPMDRDRTETQHMTRLLAACGGFLLGVLWMDLMFDVQALGTPAEGAIASIAAYYRRVTTEAYPMSRLIAAVMVLTLSAALYRLVRNGRRAAALLALLLALAAIGLAAIRVVPNAVRLGAAADPPAQLAALARAICVDHFICLGLMTAFVIAILADTTTTSVEGGAPSAPERGGVRPELEI
jgi:hypothetical protein